MHKMLLGIEHLMTDIQLMEQNPQRPPNSPYHNPAVFKFQQESPSMVRVLCEEPFQAYWPHTQGFIYSTPCSLEEITEYDKAKYSVGEAEWWAQVAGEALRGLYSPAIMDDRSTLTDLGLVRRVKKISEAPPLPVLRAMRRKHGKEADKYIQQLRWDGMNKCWFYTYAGMYLGVEEDGYIHS